MPSDCQCSNACACKTRVIEKVINNKEATAKLRRLEKEVERLTEENRSLKSDNKAKALSKKKLIEKLKNHLDRV